MRHESMEKLTICSLDQMTLPFLRDCHGFFKERHPDVLKRISNLDGSVGALFFQVGEDRMEVGCALLDGSEDLTKALRKAFAEPESRLLPTCSGHDVASPLNALATVAVAAATGAQQNAMTLASDSGQTTNALQAHYTGVSPPPVPTPLLHQTFSTMPFESTPQIGQRPLIEQNAQRPATTHHPPMSEQVPQSETHRIEGLTGSLAFPLHPEQLASNNPSLRFAPGLGACDKHLTTGHILVSGSESISNERASRGGSHADQSWTQSGTAQEIPLNVALTTPFDQFDQTEMTAVDRGTTWDYEFWSREWMNGQFNSHLTA